MAFDFRSTLAAALLVAASGFSAPALAQQQPAVELDGEVMLERTVVEDGVERIELVAPTTVVPGDRLVFSTSYTNQSTDVVEDFVVTNPLPGAIRLASEDGDFVVSVDGGTNFGALADFTVADDSVEGGERAAQLSDVTHLRWTLDRLEPGDAGTLEYHAVVR